MMESLATLLSRQSMMFEETIYGIVERITKKESSDSDGNSKEEYSVSVGIEPLTKVYSICIFDMRSPKKLDEVETDSIGSLSLNNSGFNIGGDSNSDGSYNREKEKIIVLAVFKASRYENYNPPYDPTNNNNWNYNHHSSSIGVGGSYRYGSSSSSSDDGDSDEPPSTVNVNIKYYNYKAIDAIYGTDYIVKDGKVYFRVSSVQQQSCNEYKFDFKFESSSKQYFTLQNGVIVHI